MDGKGRAMDNVFIERLWRSLKYEEIYLKEYETVADLGSSAESVGKIRAPAEWRRGGGLVRLVPLLFCSGFLRISAYRRRH